MRAGAGKSMKTATIGHEGLMSRISATSKSLFSVGKWTGGAGAKLKKRSMRAYYIPGAAGVLMIVSAFLPWMSLGDVSLGGVPETAGLSILGLGSLAVLLAGLSLWTRKNSRHPLLLVGLAAFAILFLGYQWMSRAVRDAAWAQAQAHAIVTNTPAGAAPETAVGPGIYLGMVAAAVLVAFGLTIVVKRVPRAYAIPEDDDI
jgi:hypothetical protein